MWSIKSRKQTVHLVKNLLQLLLFPANCSFSFSLSIFYCCASAPTTLHTIYSLLTTSLTKPPSSPRLVVYIFLKGKSRSSLGEKRDFSEESIVCRHWERKKEHTPAPTFFQRKESFSLLRLMGLSGSGWVVEQSCSFP